MTVENEFPYPKESFVALLKDYYTGINGPDRFDETKQWQSDIYTATVNCSRGYVLEKAGFSLVTISGGTINGSPGNITLFETLAYPQNPAIPGFIIMTNMNHSDDRGTMVVFFTDLIIQNKKPRSEDTKQFAAALTGVCEQYGHSFEELNATTAGQGVLGGNAGECGFLGFFEEKDTDFLEAVITTVLEIYKKILLDNKANPDTTDFTSTYSSRARLIDWIITQNYGIQVGRENGIPLEVIESYGFPPVVRY
ncbi:hypothetical protein ACFL43_00685 [Thermodesulfobacteriota bacterium]